MAYFTIKPLSTFAIGGIMKTITIRGIDPQLDKALRQKAIKENESTNKTVLKILRKSLGLDRKTIFKKYSDLDHLAGTWDKTDAQEFEENTQMFNKIDPEIWE
jgi:plasmid stability protein